MAESWTPLECPCEARYIEPCFAYDRPVEGEIVFAYGQRDDYEREIRRCRLCGHFIEVHDFRQDGLYAGDYVDTTYGGRDGMRAAFARILALDESKSDNAGRVERIRRIADGHFGDGAFAGRTPKILDVGSGLCVFLHRMKQLGWDCTALDVDPRQTQHAEEVAGVPAVCGDFLTTDTLGRYDVITFNKVLEHVDQAVATLARARDFLQPGGFAYVEVPDGEAAVAEGRTREEFLLGHRHVFSAASLLMLGRRAGFKVVELERLCEPSTKFTLWAVFVSDAEASPSRSSLS